MRHAAVALVLLVTGLITHYGFQQVEPALAAEAWNIGGALGRAVLLLLVAVAYTSPAVGAVVAWWAFEEVQVVVCGVAWVISPWHVEPGGERCSAWLGIPMGLLGLIAALLLAGFIHQTKGKHRG